MLHASVAESLHEKELSRLRALIAALTQEKLELQRRGRHTRETLDILRDSFSCARKELEHLRVRVAELEARIAA